MAKIAFTAGRVSGFKCPPDKKQAFMWDVTPPGPDPTSPPPPAPTTLPPTVPPTGGEGVTARIAIDKLTFGPRPGLAAAIEARGVNDLAKRALQTSSQVFRYAIAHGKAVRNPATAQNIRLSSVKSTLRRWKSILFHPLKPPGMSVLRSDVFSTNIFAA